MRLGAMMAVYLVFHGGAGGFPRAFSRKRPPAARWGCEVARVAWRTPAIWQEKVSGGGGGAAIGCVRCLSNCLTEVGICEEEEEEMKEA